MKLVDEIIDGAVDGRTPLADVLRKCLVLSFQLKNDRLKEWVEKELNGYGREDTLPEYRDLQLHSKGHFLGAAGASISNLPLPLAVLDQKHQAYMRTAKCKAPIASYDTGGKTDEDQNAIIPWPPDLIAVYQSKFINGYTLAQAWQEVPASALVSLVETVRNRVLRFALEIRDELGLVSDNAQELPKAKVEQIVTNYIYGGTNIIGGIVRDFTQIGSIVVGKGDFDSLCKALNTLDIHQPDIQTLTKAIEEDGAVSKGLGEKTMAWIMEIGKKFTNIGLDVGKALVTKWLMQYLGLGQ